MEKKRSLNKFLVWMLVFGLFIVCGAVCAAVSVAASVNVRTGLDAHNRASGDIMLYVHVTDIGAAVMEYGVVYSAVNAMPILGGHNDFTSVFGTGGGRLSDFQSGKSIFPSLGGATGPVTLFIRAFVTTHFGTVYGNVIQLQNVTPMGVNIVSVNVTGTDTATVTIGVAGIAEGRIPEWGVIFGESVAQLDGGSAIRVFAPTSVHMNAPTNPGATVRLENLSPGTTYYIRAFARAVDPFADRIYSQRTEIFTTHDNHRPTVRTVRADFNDHGAREHPGLISAVGQVTDIGTGELLEFGFAWSEDINDFPDRANRSASGFYNIGTENFAAALLPFAPPGASGFANYVWAYAINSAGIAFGEPIAVTGVMRENLGLTMHPVTLMPGYEHDAAIFSAEINFDGVEILEKGFVFSGDFSEPTIENGTILRHPRTPYRDFSVTIGDLGAQRSYFVRAFARIGPTVADIIYSNALYFFTDPLPVEGPFMAGIGNYMFGPGQFGTNLEVATMLYTLLADPNHIYSSPHNFPDVDYSHFLTSNIVNFVSGRGYMIGCDRGLFSPDAPITRGAVAVIICEVMGLLHEYDGPVPIPSAFADTYHHWSRGFVYLAARRGIFSGHSEGGVMVFRPDDFVTRAELAAIFSQMLQRRNQPLGQTHFTDVPPYHWAFTFIMNAAVPVR